MAHALQAAQEWLSGFAWRALGALLVLAAGWLVAKAAGWLLYRMAERREPVVPEMRFALPAMVRLGVVVVAIALALDVLGIAEPVIGVVVTVGLAVGLLSDVISGMRNVALRQFEIGDIIEIKEDGIAGRVQAVNMLSTTVRCRDDTEAFIPNRKLVDRLVIKHSPQRGEVLTMPLALAPTMEVAALEQEIRRVLDATPGVVTDYPPEVRLTKVEADAVTFAVKVRASPFDAEQVMSEFLRQAKEHFDAQGIVVRALGPHE